MLLVAFSVLRTYLRSSAFWSRSHVMQSLICHCPNFFTDHVNKYTSLTIFTCTHRSPRRSFSIPFVVSLNILQRSIDFSHLDRIPGARTVATYFARIQPSRLIQPTFTCSLHYLGLDFCFPVSCCRTKSSKEGPSDGAGWPVPILQTEFASGL